MLEGKIMDGNVVRYKHTALCIILGYDESMDIIKIRGIDDGQIFGFYNRCDLSGIPLTESLYDHLALYQAESHETVSDTRRIKLLMAEGRFYFVHDQYKIEISYLHQLQNIYTIILQKDLHLPFGNKKLKM